ncbi:hypothetical protein D6C92_07942 [Aureobasidium pullulans]|nr:hypothetical protein D6C92_07942 [Aureobasidium pullulans]
MTTTQSTEEKPCVVLLNRLTSDGNQSKHPNGTSGSKPAQHSHIVSFHNSIAAELAIETPVIIPLLSDFPENYALFYVTRQDESKDDLYLWGHPSGKSFRSGSQFAKHVSWLMKRDPYYMVKGDEDAKVAKCECMLCKT